MARAPPLDAQQIVLRAYDALAKNGKPNATQYTTLCGVVMRTTDGADGTNDVVVALGTGCKCVPARRRDGEGYVVADSHAEVIARRAFVRWLMEQAASAATGDGAASAAFERVRDDDVGDDGGDEDDDDDDEGNSDDDSSRDVATAMARANAMRRKCALVRTKPGVEFHMYCSQPPCGDASVFDRPNSRRADGASASTRAADGDGEVLKRAKTIGAGGGGAGATGAKLLVAPSGDIDPEHGVREQRLGAARLKPGRGDPCDCMSCSDKLCRWCVVGFEGALLSSVVLEPIFMTSITVAAPNVYTDDGARMESGEDVDIVRANVLNALTRAIETRMHFASAPPRRPALSCAAPSDAALASYEGMTNGDRIACPTTISHIHRAREHHDAFDGQPTTEVTLGARGYKLGYKHASSSKDDADVVIKDAAKFAAQICPRFTFARFIDVIATFAKHHPALAARNAITRLVVVDDASDAARPTYADVKRAAKRLSGYGVVDRASRASQNSPLAQWVDSARKRLAYNAFTVAIEE